MTSAVIANDHLAALGYSRGDIVNFYLDAEGRISGIAPKQIPPQGGALGALTP